MLGELNGDQINSLLFSRVVGRLACTDNNQPYIVPVTYIYDGKNIYGQTNEDMKLEILRKNPKVCFEVDRMTDMRNWQSAIVFGEFEELGITDAEDARTRLFSRVYRLMTSSTIHPFGHEVTGNVDDSTRVKHVMYKIKIQEMSGKFEKQ